MTKQILFVIVGFVLALSLAEEYPAIGIAATLWGRKVSLMGGFNGHTESNRHDQLHLFSMYFSFITIFDSKLIANFRLHFVI